MDNLYLKFGMLFIAVIIIMLLINYAWRSVLSNKFQPDEEEQSVSGDYKFIVNRIVELCKVCLEHSNVNKDCFILRLELTEGSINPGLLPDEFDTSINLMPGNYILKLSSENDLWSEP